MVSLVYTCVGNDEQAVDDMHDNSNMLIYRDFFQPQNEKRFGIKGNNNGVPQITVSSAGEYEKEYIYFIQHNYPLIDVRLLMS